MGDMLISGENALKTPSDEEVSNGVEQPLEALLLESREEVFSPHNSDLLSSIDLLNVADEDFDSTEDPFFSEIYSMIENGMMDKPELTKGMRESEKSELGSGGKFEDQLLKAREEGEKSKEITTFDNDDDDVDEAVENDVDKKSRFPCARCGRSFQFPCQLKRHQLIHSGERLFPCRECGRAFQQAANLQRHALVAHSGARPFPCDECGKRFSQAAQLTIHKRAHTGERPFVCDKCGKRFVRSGHLAAHMRSHTGERRFRCEVCGKAFAESCTLRLHERIHTGERPFVCAVCGKAFGQGVSLTKHQNVHATPADSAPPLVCDVCGVPFAHARSLNIHKLHVHKHKHKHKR